MHYSRRHFAMGLLKAANTRCDILRGSLHGILTSKNTRNTELRIGRQFSQKMWEIIKYYLNKNPLLLYFIENPAFSQICKRQCASEFADPSIILDYCCYGSEGYRKRTRFGTNSNYIPRPLCNPKICVSCPDGKTHSKSAQKGPCRGKDFTVDRFSTDALHAYPDPLTKEIFEHCQDLIWQVI